MNQINNYLKKAARWSRFLVFLPGVRAIFLSGSLAQGIGTDQSDIDIFIVARKGKIFTARFFVAGFLCLFRQLANQEKNHAGKICPNHFITDGSLEIREKDSYAAKLFSHNQFLAGDLSIWDKFRAVNASWIMSFGEKFKEESFLIEKEELVKNGKNGLLEKYLKKIQIRKIEKNKKNIPLEAKIILEDFEIRLHPNPKGNQNS
ncbi:nucleotidyltransferase domain-containing protein [Candidatus Gracilibacteria bacterium]|nr:nucleotidyltransferase domain-containing protein [Candidatus Gracilibacteria bacterium]